MSGQVGFEVSRPLACYEVLICLDFETCSLDLMFKRRLKLVSKQSCVVPKPLVLWIKSSSCPSFLLCTETQLCVVLCFERHFVFFCLVLNAVKARSRFLLYLCTFN